MEVKELNALFNKYELEFRIEDLNDCTPEMLIELLEKLIDKKINNVHRNPYNENQTRRNIEVLLRYLQEIGVKGLRRNYSEYGDLVIDLVHVFHRIEQIVSQKSVTPITEDDGDDLEDLDEEGKEDVYDRLYEQTMRKYESIYQDLSQNFEPLDLKNRRKTVVDSDEGREEVEGEKEDVNSRRTTIDSNISSPHYSISSKRTSTHSKPKSEIQTPKYHSRRRKPKKKPEDDEDFQLDEESSELFDSFRQIRGQYLDWKRKNPKHRKKKRVKNLSYFQRRYRKYLKQFVHGQPKHMTNTELRNMMRDQKIERLRQKKTRKNLYDSYKYLELERLQKEETLLKDLHKRLIQVEKTHIQFQNKQEKELARELEQDHTSHVSSIMNNYSVQIKLLRNLIHKMKHGKISSVKARKMASVLFSNNVDELGEEALSRLDLKQSLLYK